MIFLALLTLVIGQHVSWTEPTGDVRCGTVSDIDHWGIGGTTRVWILPDFNKHFYSIQPVENVRAGCPK